MVLRLSRVRFCLSLFLLSPGLLSAQEGDGGATVTNDGGGQTVLQSIAVPPLARAPFSLTLAAEWARSMTNGGTFTTMNARPIKRDSLGRIYEERVLMVPKGSKIPLVTNLIQIEDPLRSPMITLREFSYSKDLGLNLRSVVDAPSIGRQTFTVTQIDRTDPEPK